jgi:uncharacterized protein YcbK (DUF882 family)
MQRRTFLIGGMAALAAGPRILYAKTGPLPRQLDLYHTHTDESLEVAYRPGAGVPVGSMNRLDHFLRDFRTGDVIEIDHCLFDILAELKHRARNPDGVFEIISAYRSPKTNEALRHRSKHSGVARHSLHMQGRALDIRLRGTATSHLRDLAMELRRGGVGYYRRSNFIHVDTGRVRHW